MALVRKALPSDKDSLIPLLEGYRSFYKQEANPEKSAAFLTERLAARDSIIFVAEDEGKLLGFMQLYPSFSTVSLERVWILNDLFVAATARSQGIGQSLLRAAQDFCREQGAKGLALETGVENPAQKLYESLGWEKDTHCFHYFWKASAK
ncbi:Ribosomal protein S18 acetylase RimI [Robiginitalea myxolifaciens]|uniref:Ribosomal protein S18 acetylase RimI n=1 Tax=Robiginitalea myxolifaciens TaxID=400055 RepID=A0A1I6GRD0_9FLAO|nr:GNAT family N-acetyltransferase [Robiginitalea myxolifaciens]SFR44813.1 Ribosomal protein S18 acetylase RimI [Robiginitalea myxolifaciens]